MFSKDLFFSFKKMRQRQRERREKVEGTEGGRERERKEKGKKEANKLAFSTLLHHNNLL